MKRILLCVIIAFTAFPAHAQERAVKYSVRRNADGSRTINFQNNGPGRNTLIIYFTDMSNADSPNPVLFTSRPDTPMDSVRFGRKDAAKQIEYSGRKSWIVPGPVDAAPDAGFAYNLPCEKGKHCFPSFLVAPAESNLMGYQFIMYEGDQICAVRGGTVMKAVDSMDLDNERHGDYFSNERNRITIQHEDGSLAEYSVLKHRSFRVKPGDKVKAGDPLAVAGSLGDGKYQARIIFFYYRLDPSRTFDPAKGSSSIIDTKYFIPYFITEKGKAQLDEWKSYGHPGGAHEPNQNSNDMKKSVFPLLATAIAMNLSAQPHPVSLDYKYVEENELKIVIGKNSPGTYTMFIRFNELQNCNASDPEMYKLYSVSQEYTLKRIIKDTPVTFAGSNYWYIAGEVNSKVDTSFVYRLPYSPDNVPVVQKLHSIDHVYFGEEVKNYQAFQFLMEKGDTVYSARKGIVTEVINRHEPITDKGRISFSDQQNSVTIQHTDGTIAYYSVLEKGSIAVSEGDIVYPDTPIGLAGTYDTIVYQSRLMIYYYTYDKKNKIDERKGVRSFVKTNYINPVFATSKGNITLEPMKAYIAVSNDEIITREFTKKEKKEYEKNRAK